MSLLKQLQNSVKTLLGAEPTKGKLTLWDAADHKDRLLKSSHTTQFFQLAPTYLAQINPFYASVACMVTVLNSLRLEKGTIPSQAGFDFKTTTPKGKPKLIPYRMYSQLTLLNSKTEKVKKKIEIAPSIRPDNGEPEGEFNPGLSLQEVKKILEIYNAKAEVIYTIQDQWSGIAHLREDLKTALGGLKKFVVFNFDGAALGVGEGTHYATAGIYDAEMDEVLLLDATCHVNPWYWVPLTVLYNAMSGKDGAEPRGYVLISEGTTLPQV